ncbi:MAG TPA: hypothetical protein VK636_15120 [Gemmatimonadaceae bacterium]|nr:hypothetical protein [Gemmatimonadaceae bacterium]
MKTAAVPALGPAEAVALAPKVRSLRPEPATVTLHVGQIVDFSTLTIIVVDSAGKDRGQLLGYDFSIKPGEAAEAVPRKITGKRPGETDLVIHYPRSAWKSRIDPRAEAKIHIVVKP